MTSKEKSFNINISNLSTATNMFLIKSIEMRGLPFEVKAESKKS